MGARTKIEWCDATWNPITGCFNECQYCYARRLVERFAGSGKYANVFVEDKPVLGEDGKAQPYPHSFSPTYHRYRLDAPQKWHEPKRVFVCSMADMFGNWIKDEWILEIFEACRRAPQHTYLFLTKYPERYCDLANRKLLPKDENFWWGTTVTGRNSRRYPGRITDHTFLSIEPLTEYLGAGLGSFGGAEWIIIGAETGNRKEKAVPESAWVENICEAAEITHAAVFMKDSLIPVVGEENMRREFPKRMEK